MEKIDKQENTVVETSTENGIVYLIQPKELICTKKYKVGCSSKSDLSRCKSYRKGSRYLIIMECKYPIKVESEIIKNFNKKFKLIAGKEFFE